MQYANKPKIKQGTDANWMFYSPENNVFQATFLFSEVTEDMQSFI